MQDLLAPLPTEILALIDDQVIRQLARTKRALARADLQYELARAELKAQDGKPGKTSATASSTTAKKERKVVEGEPNAEDSDTKNNTKRKNADAISQLDVEETARHLLLEELTAEHAKRIEASAEEREPTQEIEGLPKLTKFLICVSEDVGSTRRLTFDANAFTGAPLFQGDDEDEKDAEKFIINEEVYAYVGGEDDNLLALWSF